MITKPWILWLCVFLVGPIFAQESASKEPNSDEPPTVTEELVVSASRKTEKKREAPVTIEAVSATQIAQSAQPSAFDAAATMKGVDYVKGGLNYQRISARGFSTSFVERMISMVDGRLATTPGGSTAQNFLQPTIPLDVKGVEVLIGPAAALYGPNAAAGVYNVLTKTPWDERGTSINLRVGNQSLVDTQIRHADISENGKFAWKVTAGYLDGEDFDSDNVYFADGSNQSTHTAAQTAAALEAGTAWREDELASLDVGSRRAKAALYYNFNEDWRMGANYGWSENDGLGTTNLGRNRYDNFELVEYGFDLKHPNFYAHYERTQNDAGNSFGVQNVTPYLRAGIPLDTVTSSLAYARLYDDSTLDDFEVQANHSWGRFEVVGGASHRLFRIDSFGTYLDDFRDAQGNELAPIKRDETGIYAQIDARFFDERLRFTLANRYDESNEFDGQTSPKFTIVYNNGDHYFRTGYNKAYRDPSILENHLFFGNGRALGNGRGWRVRSLVTGQIIAEYPALTPEEVETIELGYRAVFNNGLSLDLVAYQSDFTNFISALQLIAFALHPTNPTVAIDADGVVKPVVLTYLNYGGAKVNGFDIGLDWVYSPHFAASISYGHQKLDEFTNNTSIPDLPFNTPESKIKGSLNWSDLLIKGSYLNLSGRNAEAYDYLSGRWVGEVPGSTILDFATGYNWAEKNMTFKLAATNLTDSDKIVLVGIPATGRLVTVEVGKKF